MGKASRRMSKGRLNERPTRRFICGHCPGAKYEKHDDWNDAWRDWVGHNSRYHNGSRSNGFRLRNISDDSWQGIVGRQYVPAIVQEFANG